MKNFNLLMRFPVRAALGLTVLIPFAVSSCDRDVYPDDFSPSPDSRGALLSAASETEEAAQLLSELPLTLAQVKEVFDAVTASADNGYDEEYEFRSVFESPGAGVGDQILESKSAISSYEESLGSLIKASVPQTKASASLDWLTENGLQIYWPYSEDWDGVSMPVVTFDSGDGCETARGFFREQLPSGEWIVKEMVVDEEYARKHPVWVVNYNQDSKYMTPRMMEKLRSERLGASGSADVLATKASGDFKTLRLKEIKAHRNFDSWLAGASELLVKCGSIKAFTAEVVEDMTRYSPEITDFVIVVKRKYVGTYLRFNAVLAAELTSQVENLAFLIIEDDGGKRTSWKCAGSVKIKSRSYGFEVEFPLNTNDDIVWRGKLSRGYIDKYNGKPNRLGDVSVNLTLD